MKKITCLIALAVLLPIAGSATRAQIHLGDDAETLPPSPPVTITVPDDELCDADDETGDAVLDCFVTKVITDLDAAIPTATFWGTFCNEPSVSAGETDGSMTPLNILSSGTHFITVDLADTNPMDQLFRIECPCESCDCKVTLGAVGPVGPTGAKGDRGDPGPAGVTGPTGPDDPDLETIKAKICELCVATNSLPLPDFCCFDPSSFAGTMDSDGFVEDCSAFTDCNVQQCHSVAGGAFHCDQCIAGQFGDGCGSVAECCADCTNGLQAACSGVCSLACFDPGSYASSMDDEGFVQTCAAITDCNAQECHLLSGAVFHCDQCIAGEFGDGCGSVAECCADCENGLQASCSNVCGG